MTSLLQAPPFYRFHVGSFVGTVVSDGTLPLGNCHESFPDLAAREIDEQLSSNFLSREPRLEQNILILHAGRHVIIFDTGKGEVDLPGYRTGKLLRSMRAAGIDPAAITAVVLSHAHSDHCGGCMSLAGERHFPNAQFYIMQADYEFWTDPDRVPRRYTAWLDAARRNLLPNRDRIHFYHSGEEFLSGVTALHAPGHTVGHTVFLISDEDQTLCLLGDLAHHPVLLLQRPLTQFVHDTDPVLGAVSRVKILGMIADQRLRLLGYHYPWPGLGHVARMDEGFRFFPEPMDLEWRPELPPDSTRTR
ncbi:MBL fold metallo-hydrolase [Lichenicoccus sp.]|uniref:MBL fold metallo-hydrolase n=1 Tax=Lichenicoccus sp. TaxID=2781899 RepID=UPI003D1016E5